MHLKSTAENPKKSTSAKSLLPTIGNLWQSASGNYLAAVDPICRVLFCRQIISSNTKGRQKEPYEFAQHFAVKSFGLYHSRKYALLPRRWPRKSRHRLRPRFFRFKLLENPPKGSPTLNTPLRTAPDSVFRNSQPHAQKSLLCGLPNIILHKSWLLHGPLPTLFLFCITMMCLVNVYTHLVA